MGDRVEIRGERLTRLPRQSELKRRSPGGGVHVVAANLDLLIVVVAPEPPPRVGLVDRCAVAARAAGIECALVVNKRDLPSFGAVLAALEPIFGPAMPVLGVSALGDLEALLALIGQRRAIFAGHSGVGKSSLTNALIPGLALDVGALSDASGRGKHTTTVSTLHALPGGGELVDTPGIREFGLVEIEPLELARHFVGFEALGPCRFRDCLHDREPGCALDEEEISDERRAAYRALLAEL